MGWANFVSPYTNAPTIFECPVTQANEFEDQTDYFFNARLSHFGMKDIGISSAVILGGDGQENSASRAAIFSLPPNWPPSMRHLEGANFLFADGHVKWNKAKSIEKPRWSFDPKFSP